jgi:AraC-like DNA-binding protein
MATSPLGSVWTAPPPGLPGLECGRSEIRRLPLGDDRGWIEVLRARHQGVRFAPHAHAEYALGVALDGLHVLVARGEQQTVRRGDVIVLPPETIHAVRSPNEASWSYLMLYVPAIALQARLGTPDTVWRGRAGRVVLHEDGAFGALREIGEALLAPSGEGAAPAALAAIERFARDWMEPVAHSGVATSADGAVQAMLSLVRDPNTRAPSLRSVCAAFGISVFQLIRRFRLAMDAPPIAYHVQWRARRARDLMLETGSISVAALRAGYSDQSHLNRHFKRVFGLTPGEYLRGVREVGRMRPTLPRSASRTADSPSAV